MHVVNTMKCFFFCCFFFGESARDIYFVKVCTHPVSWYTNFIKLDVCCMQIEKYLSPALRNYMGDKAETLQICSLASTKTLFLLLLHLVAMAN